MNRVSKAVVLVSTLSATAAALYLVSESIREVAVVGIVVAALTAALARWKPGAAIATLLALAYVAPVLWLLRLGEENYTFEIAWIAPLVVLLAVDRGSGEWSLPESWRAPLVLWALIVAVAWPIVAYRELSFDVSMLWVRGASTTRVGVSPGESVLWSIHVALGHLAGLLWVDGLWRRFGRDGMSAFGRQVLWPLGAAAVVASLIGAYQGFVRIDALNGHVWPNMNRAAGTFMDANTFGMVTALWGPALVALALGARRNALPLVLAALMVSFIGVWTSGSRTALAGFGFALALSAPASWRVATRHLTPALRRAAAWAAASAAVIVVALMALVAGGSSTTSVLARIPSLVPGMEEGSTFGGTVLQLWERFGYGTAAMRMIAEHPLQGVGLGGFNTLVRDYADSFRGEPLAADNAQNWFRHLAAELGLLGCIGAFWWTAVVVRRLLRRSTWTGDDPAVPLVGAALAAFGLLSLLGVPGQAAPVVITFWTFVFWFWRLAVPAETPASASWNAATAALVVLAVLTHAGLTVSAARGDLLPAHRAERFGWPYSFGISRLENTPDGMLGRRWTFERSLSTIPVEGKVLKFVAWVEHPDADQRPVHLKVVADGRRVFEGDLKRASAIYVDIPATPGARNLVLETFIDRTFRPSDYGSRDRRDLGLAIQDWRWE